MNLKKNCHESVVWVMLVASICLTPLMATELPTGIITVARSTIPPEVSKAFALIVLSSLSLGVWLWSLWRHKANHLRYNHSLLIALGLMGVMILSAIFGLSPFLTLFGMSGAHGLIVMTFLLVIFLLLTQMLTNTGRIRALTCAILVAASVAASLSVIQSISVHIGFFRFPESLASIEWYSAQGSGVLGNPNLAAAFFAPHALLALGLSILSLEQPHGRFARRRSSLVFATVVLTSAVVITQSRAAIVSLLVGVVLLLFVLRGFQCKPKHIGKIIGLVTILSLLIVLLAGGFSPLANKIVGNNTTEIKSLYEDTALETIDAYTSGRLSLWLQSPQLIAQRPLLGTGPGLYRMGTWMVRETLADPVTGVRIANDDPHNYLLAIAATLGIPGALLSVLLIVYAIFNGFRQLSGFGTEVSEGQYVYALWLVLLIVCCVVACFTNMSIALTLILVVACAVQLSPRMGTVRLPEQRRKAALTLVSFCAIPLMVFAVISAQLFGRWLLADRPVLQYAETQDGRYLAEARRLAPWDRSVRELELMLLQDNLLDSSDRNKALVTILATTDEMLEEMPLDLLLMLQRNDLIVIAYEIGVNNPELNAGIRQRMIRDRTIYPQIVDLMIDQYVIEFYSGSQEAALDGLKALPRTVRGDVARLFLLSDLGRESEARELLSDIQNRYPRSSFIQDSLYSFQ